METHPFIEASRELRERFVTLLDSLSSLQALTTLEQETQSESDLLGQALGVLMSNQDVERCSVFLVTGQQLVCAVGLDWDNHLHTYEKHPNHSPYVFRLGEGIIGEAASKKTLVHSKNTSLDSRFLPLSSDNPDKSPGSLIAVPIISAARVLGVLNASHPHPDFFHPWHNNALMIFSNVLGQMLGHHRLLMDLENKVARRTRQLEEALRTTEELKLRYEQLSVVDDLTQLYNRRFFFPETSAELSRALRNREPFSIMLLDLDHFKRINDTFGHSTGDQVLKGVADALKEHTREGDIVARFGGEEFVLALPNTDGQGASQFAERLRKSINAKKWVTPKKTLSLTLSIGICCLGTVASDLASTTDAVVILDEMVRQADEALYYCKENGRDRSYIYKKMA